MERKRRGSMGEWLIRREGVGPASYDSISIHMHLASSHRREKWREGGIRPPHQSSVEQLLLWLNSRRPHPHKLPPSHKPRSLQWKRKVYLSVSHRLYSPLFCLAAENKQSSNHQKTFPPETSRHPSRAPHGLQHFFDRVVQSAK